MASPAPTDHRPALDGVRGLAVLLVVASHLEAFLTPGGRERLPAGFLGVDLFFVLSGYLVTGILLHEHGRSATVRLGRFYLRRAARLLPALAFLLVGHALWVWLADLPVRWSTEYESWVAALLYVANWNQALGRGVSFGLGHLWSLSVEGQFYLVWPVALLAARRWRHGIVAAISAGVVVALVVRLRLFESGENPFFIYLRTDARVDALLAGAAAAVLAHRGVLQRVDDRVKQVLAVAGLAVVLVASVTLTATDAVLYRGGFTVIALAAAALVVGVELERWWLARAFSLRPLTLLGRVSYGVYLWHFPVILGVRRALPDLTALAQGALSMAVTAALVAVSWFWVERPVQAWVRRRTGRGGAPAVAPLPAAAPGPAVATHSTPEPGGRHRLSRSTTGG